MSNIIRRELIYFWYYSSIQFEQIFGFWLIGIALGSMIAVFGKEKIHKLFESIQSKHLGILGVVPASLLGIASPLCMYGTIPIAASFSEKGVRDDYLAAFMMSSILLNPQLIIYSAALGRTAVVIRVVSCSVCGMVAGICIHFFYKNKKFFDFSRFGESVSRDTDPNMFIRLLKNIARNIKATCGYFLIGIILAALFQRYVPSDKFAALFGSQKGFGVLMAATIGVPLYICGGGTIPLLMDWINSGMSMGAVSAFMITGPATKITNLGAVKIVLGIRRFIIYIAFVMVFALSTGLLLIGI